jgi:hypothetical protein
LTPLCRLAHRLAEKLLGRWREGPDPPARISEEVDRFTLHHPTATPGEWEAFAARLAALAYREGYQRGWEAGERLDRPWRGDWTPERLADLERPGWRGEPPVER